MKSRTLLAFTASALALPGISNKAQADAAPTSSTVSYRYSAYREDDLPDQNLLIGSKERYDIDVHQFRLLMPVGENYSLNINAGYESMSGASPWYTIGNAQGGASVVMSGASISEQRRDFTASARRYLENGTIGISLGSSDENDYRSYSLGMDTERHFNNELTTVSTGFSLSNDNLSPTDAALFNRITDASKNSRSLFLSATQVLDRNSLLQVGISFTKLSGFLTDPYKLSDQRPDSRTQVALSSAYRRFFSGPNAALHADYRYYHDSFGINSHTMELSWYQNLGDNWQVIPGIRYYSQSEADFFTPVSDFVATGPNSADYRLSAYGALSYQLGLRIQLEDLNIILNAERYLSGAGRGVHDGPSSPALVDFTRLGIGFDYSF